MNKFKKSILLACALSIGLTPTVNAETQYYTHKYEAQSTNEFPDLESNQRRYSGYTDQSRVSNGQAFNPVDAEISHMRNQAEQGSINYNPEGRRTGNIYETANEIDVATYNYEESIKLEKKAAEYDTQRKQEIGLAREHRQRNIMPGCGGDTDCFANLKQSEDEELRKIEEREAERQKKIDYQNTAMASKSQTDSIRKQYTGSDGSITDKVEFAAKAGAAAFAANIVATAAFCMMDISAAKREPDCKKAICEVHGKKVCKQFF